MPDIETRAGADPRWSSTLDTLRTPPRDGKRGFEWRRTAPIRPLVFEPPAGLDDKVVQMHLSHRLVQRLLGRFHAQGFVLHDLSRACLVQSEDRVPRVVLLARLAVFGPRASRLHEEILTVTAHWTPPDKRSAPLTPFARDAEAKTMALLQKSLAPGALELPEAISAQLSAAIQCDVSELLAHLAPRGAAALDDARAKLATRADDESKGLAKILEDQRRRVLSALEDSKDDEWQQLPLALDDERRKQDEAERRQRENDIKHWHQFLANVEGDLVREPARIREFYEVKSHRLEPLGLVYLWPAKV